MHECAPAQDSKVLKLFYKCFWLQSCNNSHTDWGGPPLRVRFGPTIRDLNRFKLQTPKIQAQSARQTRQSEELGQGPDSNSTFRVQHCFCCSIHPTPHLFPNTFTESCILPQENTYFLCACKFPTPLYSAPTPQTLA